MANLFFKKQEIWANDDNIDLMVDLIVAIKKAMPLGNAFILLVVFDWCFSNPDTTYSTKVSF